MPCRYENHKIKDSSLKYDTLDLQIISIRSAKDDISSKMGLPSISSKILVINKIKKAVTFDFTCILILVDIVQLRCAIVNIES